MEKSFVPRAQTRLKLEPHRQTFPQTVLVWATVLIGLSAVIYFGIARADLVPALKDNVYFLDGFMIALTTLFFYLTHKHVPHQEGQFHVDVPMSWAGGHEVLATPNKRAKSNAEN